MFEIENKPEATIVRVRCEIDHEVKAQFLAVLLLACQSGSARLIVSLEECRYMDCAGLSVLVRIRNLAEVPMSVVLRWDSYLWKIFAMTGLLQRLGVTESGDDGQIAPTAANTGHPSIRFAACSTSVFAKPKHGASASS